MNILKSIAHLTRIVTVAPIPAAILCAALYAGGLFSGALHLVLMLLFLTVLPLCAYPAAAAIPCLRAKGRKGQRDLAIVFSAAGYVGSVVTAFCGGSRMEKILSLTYLVSVAFIAVCSFALHFKASGHACGIAGPAFMAVWNLGPWWLMGLIVLALAWWSSAEMKRHTQWELLAGALVPVAVQAVLYAVM